MMTSDWIRLMMYIFNFSLEAWSPCFWAIFVDKKIYLFVQLLLGNDLACQRSGRATFGPGSVYLTIGASS